VFTRCALALFGQVPWRAVPVMPLEILLLPKWAPFHLSKVSYWSRTVIVPLLILMALKPRATNPRGIDIRELFTTPPEQERHYMVNATGSRWGRAFLAIDKALRLCEPWFLTNPRKRALERALAFMAERLNGEDGLGGIVPAMANAVMAYHTLGYPPDHPERAIAMQSVKKLLVLKDDWGYCQPCLSPIRACVPAAGPSSTGTTSTPMSTTPPWPAWRCCAAAASTPTPKCARPSTAPSNGSWGCRARTAAGAPSTPTTPTTT
jgi:squalene-hopene/tetraprenyl-beta-curcumene cyclase